MTSIFSKEDYNSGNGFNVHIWGGLIWNSLHIISFNYPVNPTEEDKDHYHQYLMSLKHVLPCKSCRDNYTKNLIQSGYSRSKLKDRDTFSRYVYDLHNTVNLMLGKKKYKTYNEVRDRYEMFRAKCVNSTPVGYRYETGCTKPVNNIKSQSVINIVPLEQNRETFIIDRRCIPSKKHSKKSSKKHSKKSSKKHSKKSSKKKTPNKKSSKRKN
jgi:hypothetical protein